MDRIVLYTTNGNDDELRECYNDFLFKENVSEDNISFEEWKEDELYEEWNDLCYNIKYSNYNTKCVIEGTLGLWDGEKDIIPCVCDDLAKAISKCIENSLNFEVALENGYINVLASHHDGSNNFIIHLLNKKGCNSKNADLTKSTYHKKIRFL